MTDDDIRAVREAIVEQCRREMGEPLAFICEGCGLEAHVFCDTVPPHQLCAICDWLSDSVTPAVIMPMRRRCEPGGWTPERLRRRCCG